jgi:hypothetical protein
MEGWKILSRVQGYVDSLEPGQKDWSPVFRSRRLTDGAKFRVHPHSEATLALADGTTFVLADFPRARIFEVSDYQLTSEGRSLVFWKRLEKANHDVTRVLGIQQGRFEIQQGSGPIGARG